MFLKVLRLKHNELSRIHLLMSFKNLISYLPLNALLGFVYTQPFSIFFNWNIKLTIASISQKLLHSRELVGLKPS